MSPVKPSDVEALIVNPSDSWCTAMKKLLHAMYLWFLWKRYKTAEDGLIADAFCADVSNMECPDA